MRMGWGRVFGVGGGGIDGKFLDKNLWMGAGRIISCSVHGLQSCESLHWQFWLLTHGTWTGCRQVTSTLMPHRWTTLDTLDKTVFWLIQWLAVFLPLQESQCIYAVGCDREQFDVMDISLAWGMGQSWWQIKIRVRSITVCCLLDCRSTL